MLSRLEKPWQRITLNNSSADGIPAEQASNGREGERLEEFGSAPTVDLPNTSREEKDHDSKEKLTEFPRWEDEAQPSEKSDKSEIRLPSYHDVLDAGHRALDEDLEIDVPPDPNTLHRNVGWVLWDKTQDRRLVKWLYEYCHETYGHTKLHKLPANDQVYHMLRTQCAIMFGHTNLFALDRDEEYKVLVTASSYLSAMRSSWEWDDETERWRLAWRRFGNILRHPAAHREIKIDAPYVVQKFENLAKLTELHSEDSELGVEYINPEEYEEAMSTNKGVEDLLDGLKEYAEPVDPNYMDYLQDPKTEGSFVTTESTHSFSNFSHFSGASNEDPDDQFPPAGFNFPAWRNLMQDIRRFGRVVGLRSEHESDSSFTTSSSPVYHIPPSNPLHSLDQAQKYEDILNYIRNIETPSVRPETPPINSPLNNPDEFETLQETSNRKHAHITEEQGDRVEHPETSTNPRPGPYVTSEHRRAELASYTKSITPVELVQFNYKLIPKTPSPPRDPEYPTYCEINFYEAPRALNAAWLTTRTYVGIVRWAQDASLDEHLRVLYQIRAQERREAGNSEENEEVDSGEDLYDVCHLLKDLRLDTEAEWACKQEPQGAPKTK